MVIGSVGMVWYFVCLILVGLWPRAGAARTGFDEFMGISITTISVSLATFVGMLLGLQKVSRDINQGIERSAQASASVSSKEDVKFSESETRDSSSTRTVVGADLGGLQKVADKSSGSQIQWAASGLYVLSLLIAVCFWYFNQTNSDPAIINLAKSLLGLVGGTISVLLNTNN